MLGPLTILFWVIIIIGGYIAIKFSQSRNKKIFFKGGSYKAFVLSSLILVVGGFIGYSILPTEPMAVNLQPFHSEDIISRLSEATGFERYWLQTISVFTELNLVGLLSAALILCIWVYFIRSVDFFKTEKISISAMVLVGGMITTFFTPALSDLVNDGLSIEFSNSTLYNLFAFSFLGIGVVEEAVKILPVIVVILATDEIDEPIDLIYYACLSALGFAFIENLIYFRDISNSVIVGRALTAAVGHMIAASMAIYGTVMYKYKPERKGKFFYVVYYFFLGALVHGVYDYLLFENLWLLFIGFFAFFVQAWVIMMNNAINNSQYFDYSVEYKYNIVRVNLAKYISLLIVYQFILAGFFVGKAEAVDNFLFSVSWGSLVLVFFVGLINSFDLYRGHWRPIRFNFRAPSVNAMPGMRGLSTLSPIFTENVIIPLNYVGKNIKLHCPAFNHDLSEIFHISEGRITDRITLIRENSSDPEWFIVELQAPLMVNEHYESSIILIKLESKHSSLVHDEHIRCWVKLIPAGINPLKVRESAEYVSYGYIMINGEDYVYKL